MTAERDIGNEILDGLKSLKQGQGKQNAFLREYMTDIATELVTERCLQDPAGVYQSHSVEA